MATKQRVLKFTIMQYRNPAISEEEFHAHWTTKHAVLASAWFERNGILGYRQYHTPSSTRELAANLVTGIGWEMATHDGHVEILLKDIEDLETAVQDPDYPARVGPDEAKFLDQKRSVVTVGWEEVYLRDGKVVNIDAEGRSVFANKG